MARSDKVVLVLSRPARFRKLQPDGSVAGDHLDVSGGTEVTGIRQKDGRYLVEHCGFHAYLDSFNLNLVCAGVVCKCPTDWCPRHGTIHQRRARWMK